MMDRKLFPIAEIRSLIPPAVMGGVSWLGNSKLRKFEFERDGRIDVDGRLGDGRTFEAEFSEDGRLIDFDTDD